ncbi:cytohesin-interacting protein-like [Trichomycterus rosablanca]|uniref:cytohesin-interacting protein-like n=1 Tax=Trichomycterus rosablanca TaxID=2290929 RepID=UPI002F3532B5
MFRPECKKQSRDAPTCTTPQLQIKQLAHDSSRQNVVMLKKDDEAFGFKIKTDTNYCKLVTCVCSVTKNSPAESAGIRTGDVIITVNNMCVEGFSHQQIVDLIQKGPCLLKLGIVKCTSVKQKELQQKLHHLQMQLKDKWEELQRLITQEEHIR